MCHQNTPTERVEFVTPFLSARVRSGAGVATLGSSRRGRAGPSDSRLARAGSRLSPGSLTQLDTDASEQLQVQTIARVIFM